MRLFVMVCLGMFPATVVGASARDDVMVLIAGHHPVTPAALKSLDDEKLKALRDIAHDAKSNSRKFTGKRTTRSFLVRT
jgi:hypothetical protein